MAPTSDSDLEPLSADDDIGQLAIRLVLVSAELRSLHRELAIVLVGERQAKAAVWQELAYTQAGTDKSREAMANHNAIDFTIEVLRLKGDIDSLAEYRSTILVLVELRKMGM